MIKAITIYCGSSAGKKTIYSDTAALVGRSLAENDIEIVYGGGSVGLMGVLADAALEAGGTVTGVIPRHLAELELSHPRLTQLLVTETLQERKTLMSQKADAFIALPGGGGTLDEIVEQWTWAQLGLHSKPCCFLNVSDYFSGFQTQLEKFVEEGFTPTEHANMLIFEPEIEMVLQRCSVYSPPKNKWSE